MKALLTPSGEFWEIGVTVVVFTLVGFITVWGRGLSDPSSEGMIFQKSRGYVATQQEFVAQSLSYDRTRVVGTPHPFLYHPGAQGIRVWLESKWSARWDVKLAISLFFHLCVSVLLFQFLRMSLAFWVSLIVAGVFLIHPGVSELVRDPYLSATLPGLFFLGLGVLLLQQKKGRAAVGALFFLSTLFSEVVALTLLLSAAFQLVKFCRERDPKHRRLIQVLGYPGAVYLGLNGVDFICHWISPSKVNFGFLLSLHHWVRNASNGVQEVLTSGVFLLPANGLPHWVLTLLGGCVLLAGYYGVDRLLGSQKSRKAESFTLYLLLLLFLCSNLSRGAALLSYADPRPHLWQIENIYFSLFIGMAMMGRFMNERVWLRSGVMLGCLAFIVFQLGISLESRGQSKTVQVAKDVKSISDIIDKNPGTCFGGVLTDGPTSKWLTASLITKTCTLFWGKRLVARLHERKGLSLFLYPPSLGSDLLKFLDLKKLSPGRFLIDYFGHVSIDFKIDPTKDPGVSMSRESLGLVSVGFEVNYPDTVGMVVGWKDPNQYVVLLIYDNHGFGLAKVSAGKPLWVETPELVGNFSPSRVQLRTLNGNVVLERDGVIQRVLPEVLPSDLEGRFGVFASSSRKKTQEITRVFGEVRSGSPDSINKRTLSLSRAEQKRSSE